MKVKLTVIGAGSWGTTLAKVLSDNNKQSEIMLWDINTDNLKNINMFRENKIYLPGVKLNENIFPEEDISIAIKNSEMILFVVPSHTMRDCVRKVQSSFDRAAKPILITAVKGLERGTNKRMSEIILDEFGSDAKQKIAVLSGPSHAEEVSRNVPTAIVCAGTDKDNIERIQRIFSTPYFRVYASYDMLGVELGAAVKNVIAIAAGILDGLGLGDNTKAALVTRGIKEIQRLGNALGADPETFSGLSGIGDLIVTCYSKHSRNRFVGENIGKGKKLEEILKSMIQISEGVKTTEVVMGLAESLNLEMPITEKVYEVLFNNKPPRTAIEELMTRKLKFEVE
ncbi:MAG: NAD(P)H-dependent glycerol-3-phosphate dehydrogenase [bacterium]|nr:NAD(P)H-dependent glycerol-3-phosphate dehydrogenase [bacterium]